MVYSAWGFACNLRLAETAVLCKIIGLYSVLVWRVLHQNSSATCNIQCLAGLHERIYISVLVVVFFVWHMILPGIDIHGIDNVLLKFFAPQVLPILLVVGKVIDSDDTCGFLKSWEIFTRKFQKQPQNWQSAWKKKKNKCVTAKTDSGF